MTAMRVSYRLFLFCGSWILSHALSAASDPAAAAATADPVASAPDEMPAVTEEAKPKAEPGAEQYWKAAKLFQSKTPADLEAGRSALQEAATREYPHAQLLLGECYEMGSYGFAQNKGKAAAYFRLAAERGNAFAKVSYGVCLFSGFGVRQDPAKAQEWLSAAVVDNADYALPTRPADWQETTAKNDDGIAGETFTDPVASAKARAHYILGLLAERAKKPADAQTHYVAAATAGPGGRAGIQLAAIQAALNYAFGRGVPRDTTKATAMLATARTLVRRSGVSLVHNFANAKLVDDFAVSEIEEEIGKWSDDLASELELDIARQFTDRKSKDYSPKESVQWFELAAESGKPWAMLELAQLYARGDLGAPAFDKAFYWFEKAGSGDKPKHDLGIANLIICYANGIGTVKDPAKAREIATKHARRELISYLMLKGECPTTILSFDDVLALNKRYAKERKDPFAQYVFGVRYENGWGVTADLDDAVSWYKKAAKAKCARASTRLGELYQTNRMGVYGAEATAKAIAYYKAGTEGGDPAAMAALGALTHQGTGMPQNIEAAQALYEKSLQLDPTQTFALNNLGAIFESRYREAKNASQDLIAKAACDQMIKYYERALENGLAFAGQNLGRLYYEGTLGPRDFEKAYGYFERAAELGDQDARFRLGAMHENGEGVPVTPVEAAYHYRLAALDGHAEALRRIAEFYLQGKGGAQDLERAQFWLKLMIQRGQLEALAAYIDIAIKHSAYKEAIDLLEEMTDWQNKKLAGFAYERLSRCYAYGLGVKTNESRAKRYREKAFALGDPDAMYETGYDKLQQNRPQEAVPLFAKAVTEGCSEACYTLGRMYYHGQFVPQDTKKSIEYLRQGTKLNHSGCLFYLAAMTVNGVEGAPPLDEAIELARRAEALGHKDAASVRERLEKRRRTGSPANETTPARAT